MQKKLEAKVFFHLSQEGVSKVMLMLRKKQQAALGCSTGVFTAQAEQHQPGSQRIAMVDMSAYFSGTICAHCGLCVTISGGAEMNRGFDSKSFLVIG